MQAINHLIVMILVLIVSNSYALAQNQNKSSRCWVPDAGQIETIKMLKEAERKRIKRTGITPQAFDDIIKDITISQSQRQDPKFIRATLECGVHTLYYDNDSLKKNKDFALALVKQGAITFSHLDKSLRKDWDVALTAIKYNPLAIMDVHESLKRDRDFILAAMNDSPHDWDIFKNMDAELKKDRKIVLLAVKSHGELLVEADKRFWKDKEIVIAAVKSIKATYNRLEKKDKSYKNSDVLEDLAASNDIDTSLFNDLDVIEAASTQEIGSRFYLEPCTNYCR